MERVSGRVFTEGELREEGTSGTEKKARMGEAGDLGGVAVSGTKGRYRKGEELG